MSDDRDATATAQGEREVSRLSQYSSVSVTHIYMTIVRRGSAGENVEGGIPDARLLADRVR